MLMNLHFPANRNYFDEYFSIYLTLDKLFFIFIIMFRFNNLISEGILLIFFTFIVPALL